MSTFNTDFDFTGLEEVRDLRNCRRENGFYKSLHLVALDHKMDLEEVATIRFYRAPRGNTVYCVVWVHEAGHEFYATTGGKAGGYGYDKEEAALREAIEAMGVKAGDYAYPEKFLIGLARHFGYEKAKVIEAHA